MRFKTLLVWHTYHGSVGTILDSINAIKSCGNLDVVDVDFAELEGVDVETFDVVIFHYSVVIAYTSYFSEDVRARVKRHPGLKVLFIQDEYRFIDRTARAMYELGITVVFSLISPNAVRKVYPHPWLDDVRFEHTLTGFVPEDLCRREVPPYAERPIDVSYRARKLASWMGAHTIQKWLIAERFPRDVEGRGLTLDISHREEDRLYGEAWVNLIANSKAVLGTESGASVCDFSGELQVIVEKYIAEHPDADPQEIHDKFVRHLEGNVVMNVISPRCFEAIALRTLLIMYQGEYGGVLVPHRHYVVLEKDHSNIDEVLDVLRDPAKAQAIIDRAYEEIAMSGRWTYAAMSRHLSTIIDEEYAKRPWPAPVVKVTGDPPDGGHEASRLAEEQARREAAEQAARRSFAGSIRHLEKRALARLLHAARDEKTPGILRAGLYPAIRAYSLARIAVRGAYLAVKNTPPI